ncbi:hypothetical protein GCM10010531_34840 [Blastococcus jejuensis]|uniref:Uncharacterized protein n=1 Tax=Blastococcus jejuensis TaxID=351224 RepID=A0ABP6PJ10_9ACTN
MGNDFRTDWSAMASSSSGRHRGQVPSPSCVEPFLSCLRGPSGPTRHDNLAGRLAFLTFLTFLAVPRRVPPCGHCGRGAPRHYAPCRGTGRRPTEMPTAPDSVVESGAVDARDQAESSSRMVALAMPPPSHIVCSP